MQWDLYTVHAGVVRSVSSQQFHTSSGGQEMGVATLEDTPIRTQRASESNGELLPLPVVFKKDQQQ